MRKLIVCVMQRHPPHASCGPSGGVALASMLEAAIAEKGLPISLERKNCLGSCLDGPNVRLFPDGKSWRRATQSDIPDMLASLKANDTKTENT